LGKVLVLVNEDQLSLAIGRRGQNVRLASKLVGWDINVMTQESLDEQLDISIEAFSVVPEMDPELVENLVSQGFFTFDDLSVIEPDQLADLGGLTQEQCDTIVDFADVESLRIEEEERLAAEERKRNPPPPPAKASEQEVTPQESAVAAEPEGGSADAEVLDDSGESSSAKSAATVVATEEISDAGVSTANDAANSSLPDSEEDSSSNTKELEKTSDDSESTS